MRNVFETDRKRECVLRATAHNTDMPAPAYEPAFMATAIGMVRAGLGATLLPSSALEISAASDLIVHPLDHPGLTRQLGVLKKRERSLSPAAEAFVAALRARAKEWFTGAPRPASKAKCGRAR